MTPEEMCGTCIHAAYCMGAYKKDHWCGNHTGRRQRMSRQSRELKNQQESEEGDPKGSEIESDDDE